MGMSTDGGKQKNHCDTVHLLTMSCGSVKPGSWKSLTELQAKYDSEKEDASLKQKQGVNTAAIPDVTVPSKYART